MNKGYTLLELLLVLVIILGLGWRLSEKVYIRDIGLMVSKIVFWLEIFLKRDLLLGDYL